MKLLHTIFLATTGRHVTIGRGDDLELPAVTHAAIRAQGLRGWLTVMDGSPYGGPTPRLARVHPVDGAGDDEWDAAVANFERLHAETHQ